MTETQTATLQPDATSQNQSAERTYCFHCGTRVGTISFRHADYSFCCQGCKTVFELLTESGLSDYYSLDKQAGIRVPALVPSSKFAFLDEPTVREKIVQFSNANLTRVNFRLPAIHCIACVWLLENLFKLAPGIGRTEVNFLRKEASISFDPGHIKLSEVVGLLASLGYEPDLKFSDVENSENEEKPSATPRKLWLQLGVAGFAFGNNMLFSIAIYLGLDAFHGPSVQKLVGYISMLLATPVLLYSSQDYFRLAWQGLKHRLLTIEVPIALGILVIYFQSAYEVLSGHGEGYFDSFSGLLFFLLCGRLFQQKTYSRLAFDRDFRSFFPLAIIRLGKDGEEASVSLSQLKTGDHLLVRNGELIPADSKIISGAGCIDYSFVTGEADPVEKSEGDLVYAGGRQVGASIEVETTRAVSQSYLTSLWNQDAFVKQTTDSLDTLINRYSQRFTKIIIALAFGAAVFWSFSDASIAVKAFTSILIVACPCALALAAPFTLGTAIRVLGRRNVFVKNAVVLERLAQVDTIVFDKTGTLTAAGAASIQFQGSPLSDVEQAWIRALTRHSTHPYSARIFNSISAAAANESVRSFLEIPGCGIEGNVAGHEMALGSGQWLKSRGINIPFVSAAKGSIVHLAINGHHRGTFVLASALRADVGHLLSKLSGYQTALLSGDNEKERALFEPLFGTNAELRFNQSPTDKLNFIKELQAQGKKVMMVGDGLNDAGALKQSDVGVAVVESIGAFAPASDIILAAENASRLDALLRFGKAAVKVVRLSFILSSLYNVVGIAIAAAGILAPIVCAILMPLSSITVVAFACLATTWMAHQTGMGAAQASKDLI